MDRKPCSTFAIVWSPTANLPGEPLYGAQARQSLVCYAFDRISVLHPASFGFELQTGHGRDLTNSQTPRGLSGTFAPIVSRHMSRQIRQNTLSITGIATPRSDTIAKKGAVRSPVRRYVRVNASYRQQSRVMLTYPEFELEKHKDGLLALCVHIL